LSGLADNSTGKIDAGVDFPRRLVLRIGIRMSSNGTPASVVGRWKPLLICPDRGLFGELTPIVAEISPAGVIDCSTYPSRQQLVDLVASQKPNLCLLDVGSDSGAALGLLPELARLQPPIGVVAVHSNNDPNLILTCLRKGAGESLFRPLSSTQLKLALERLSRTCSEGFLEEDRRAKVYCFMPGKGACGATTLACNVAFQIKRMTAKRTLLADLDPLTGTVAFLLKIKSSYSFMDAIAHSNHLDEDLWKGLVTLSNGLEVILPPDNPVDVLSEPYDVSTAVNFARQLYETIIIDSPGPYEDWGLNHARLADTLLLVTTNELPALLCTQRALAYLTRHGISRAKIGLLVNRYNPDVGLGREAIETALRTEVLHVVPSDYPAVHKSMMEGKPLVPGSKLAKSIEELARLLVGPGLTPPEPLPKKASLFSSLFARSSNGSASHPTG